MLSSRTIRYDVPVEFWPSVAKHIEPVDTVLDVGCGIVPMNFFRPALHIMLEPYKEYVDILLYKYSGDKSIFVLQANAQEALPHFTDNSVDTIFFLDVIEHLEKPDGLELIAHAERIARKQAIVFTPLGFMAQHVNEDMTDAWGLSGGNFQEHLSGWLPEDFTDGWDFHVCANFHEYDSRGERFAHPHGAFFAIKTFSDKASARPSKIVDLRRPLPINLEVALVQTQADLSVAKSELASTCSELFSTQAELTSIRAELASTQLELANAQLELANAQSILNHPAIRLQRKVWRSLKFWK